MFQISLRNLIIRPQRLIASGYFAEIAVKMCEHLNANGADKNGRQCRPLRGRGNEDEGNAYCAALRGTDRANHCAALRGTDRGVRAWLTLASASNMAGNGGRLT